MRRLPGVPDEPELVIGTVVVPLVQAARNTDSVVATIQIGPVVVLVNVIESKSSARVLEASY